MRTLCRSWGFASALLFSFSTIAFSAEAEWSRAYVLERQEHAFYFPGDGAAEDPGPDCPSGANPALDRRAALKTTYRSWAEVDAILDPEKPSFGRNGGFRGPNRENVYDEPWAVPDPASMREVESKISYGFDLDGDASTGFTGIDGTPGVDNNYYKMAGCMLAYRGKPRTTGQFGYEYMLNGFFTVLLVVSGDGDEPMNDANVKVAYYLSADDILKDANGDVTPHLTYRVDPDPRFQSVFDAKTENGVLTATHPQTLVLHDQVQASFFPQILTLHQGQVKFDMHEDGSLSGVIGGYQSTEHFFLGWSDAGGIHESVSRVDIPAYWYALRRNADYQIDPGAPFNDAISAAYRQYFLPAYVTFPDGKAQLTEAKLVEGEIDEKWSRRPARKRNPEWRY